MAFQPHTHQFIEIEVPDFVQDETIFKQKARFKKMVHEQQDDGSCTVELQVKLLQYSVGPDDSYGDPLPASRFLSIQRQLRGANDTLVDATTGEILAQHGQMESLEEWLTRIEQLSTDRDTMLQGDFFELLRDTIPVVTRLWIIKNMRAAIALGHYA